jgi:hypothetical protein
MHTGPLPMSYVPDNDDCRPSLWGADEIIACPSDDSPGADDLTPREAFELACWELAHGYAAGVL